MSQLVKGILPHEHPSSSDASSVPVAMVDLVPRRRESVNSTRVAGDVCPAEDAKIAANDIVGQGSSSSAVQTGTSSTTHVDKGKAVDPRERNGIGVDEKDSTFERDVGEPIELSVLDPRNGAEKRESRSARPQVELDAEAHHIIEVPSSQPTEPITSDLIKGKTTDPHQKGSSYLFQDDSKANYRNSQRRYTLNDQNTYPPDEPPLPVSATLWFPKITPFRLINLVVPAVLGTSKAIASQRGGTALPITLEWISGIVVFLILTMTGTYESKSYHELPWYLSWLFRTDCMDTFWRLLEFFSIERPRYAFDECSEDHSGHIVTSYRLLVTGAAAMFGVTKASLSYSGFSSGSNWVDWCYGVVATSGLYFIGLYENNSAGLMSSFFSEDGSHLINLKPRGFPFVVVVICTMVVLTIQTLPMVATGEYQPPWTNGTDNTQMPVTPMVFNRPVDRMALPILFFLPMILLYIAIVVMTVYQWWPVVRRVGYRVLPSAFRSAFHRIAGNMHTLIRRRQTYIDSLTSNLVPIGQISAVIVWNIVMGASLYVIGPVSYNNEIPSSIQVLVNMEIFLFWWMSWFLLAGGWGDEFRPDWWPTMDGLRAIFPARVMSQVVEPIVATGTRLLRRRLSNTRFVLLDMIAMLTVLSMAMGVVLIITALVFILAFSKMDTSFAPFKIPSVIALIAILLFVCWSVAGFYLPILLTGLVTHAFTIDRLHYAYLELRDSLVLDTRFLLEEDFSV